MFAWLFAHIPHLAVYLLIGYLIAKIANALYKDNRPNSDLWVLGKLARIFLFPVSYHEWSNRESKQYNEGSANTIRGMVGNYVADGTDTSEEERYCQWMMFIWPLKLLINIIWASPQILWFSVLYWPRTIFNFATGAFSFGALASSVRKSLATLAPKASSWANKLKVTFSWLVFEPARDESLGGQIRQLKSEGEKELQTPKQKLQDAQKAAAKTLELTRARILKAQEIVAQKPDTRAGRQCYKLIDTFKAREKELVQELADIDALVAEVGEQEQALNDQFELLDLYDGAETLSDDINTQARDAVAAARTALEALRKLNSRASDIEIKAMVSLDTPLDNPISRAAGDILPLESETSAPQRLTH